MIYGTSFRHSFPAPDYDANIIVPPSTPLKLDNPALLRLDAFHFEVGCQSSSDGRAPYSDLYLRMVIDVFDKEGFFIGTGYWDRLSKTLRAQATAIVVCRRDDLSLGDDPITNFLLVEEKGDHFVRVGIGHTVNALRERVSTLLELKKCERKVFLLR
jgi:hypothetical protein